MSRGCRQGSGAQPTCWGGPLGTPPPVPASPHPPRPPRSQQEQGPRRGDQAADGRRALRPHARLLGAAGREGQARGAAHPVPDDPGAEEEGDAGRGAAASAGAASGSWGGVGGSCGRRRGGAAGRGGGPYRPLLQPGRRTAQPQPAGPCRVGTPLRSRCATHRHPPTPPPTHPSAAGPEAGGPGAARGGDEDARGCARLAARPQVQLEVHDGRGD